MNGFFYYFLSKLFKNEGNEQKYAYESKLFKNSYFGIIYSVSAVFFSLILSSHLTGYEP